MERLEDLINYEPIEKDFNEIVENPELAKQLAAKLYGCSEDEIKSFKEEEVKCHGVGLIRCFNVKFSDGKKSKFYVKRSWEDGLKEAAGMELMNLLTETPFRYLLVGDKVLLVEHIEGRLFEDIHDSNYSLKKEYDNDDIKCEIGVAQEYARFLGLGDRRNDRNVILQEDKRVANIDFGFLFNNDGKYYTERFGQVKFKEEEPSIKGREKAKRVLRENLAARLPRVKAICSRLHEMQKTENNPLEVINNYCESEGWDIRVL